MWASWTSSLVDSIDSTKFYVQLAERTRLNGTLLYLVCVCVCVYNIKIFEIMYNYENLYKMSLRIFWITKNKIKKYVREYK